MFFIRKLLFSCLCRPTAAHKCSPRQRFATHFFGLLSWILEACLNFCFKHQFDIEPLPCMKQFLSTLEKFILVSFPASRQPEGQQAYSFSSTHNSPLYIAVLLLVHEGDDYLIKLVMLHHWKKSINAMFLETEKSD